MRLHRIEDGLVPQPDERKLTKYDKGGNKLRDVVDPVTGMCTGVTSPLTVPDGTRIMNPTPVSGGKSKSAPDVRFDPTREIYYELNRTRDSDPFGLVVRTVSDGDDPLPVTRIRVVQANVPGNGGKSGLPFTPVSVRQQNNEAVKAVLDAMGYKGKITPEIRQAALEMIEIEKSAACPLVRKGKKKRTSPTKTDMSAKMVKLQEKYNTSQK